MKAVSLVDTANTRQALLALAKQVPGAWIGIKIAALLLVLEGQRRGWIATLFDMSRNNMDRWIRQVNEAGVPSLEHHPGGGRPARLSAGLQRQLAKDLEEDPRSLGLPRSVWDGPMLAVYLKERFGVQLKVRQAQNWLHRLGYSLKRAGYVYIQARKEDARTFERELKKTAGTEAPEGDGSVSG